MSDAKVRFVVFHHPGPQWQTGVDFREQPGIGAHVGHYRQLLERGQLEMGGPFLLPDGGGMMVATLDVSHDELAAFAASDPAVQAGLLVFEIKPWYVPMSTLGN